VTVSISDVISLCASAVVVAKKEYE